MIAVAFWWFFLVLCPVVTLVSLFLVAWSSETLEGAIARGVITIAALALIVGPASTDVGFMSWWLVGAGGVTRSGHYMVWQYALACMLLYAAFVLLAAWSKREK